MGMDYSYMLYFKRNQMEDVLQGISAFAEKHYPPTQIIFPDHVLEIPLESGITENEIYHYDDPELGFNTVLIFDEDDAIIDWGHGNEITEKTALTLGKEYQYPVSVGYIYLTIYNDTSAYYPDIALNLEDLILFNFGTTGSRMSMLFYYSTSIRTQFVELMKKFHCVCGIFNREEEGEVFWLNGSPICEYIDDVWLSPDEIIKQFSKD